MKEYMQSARDVLSQKQVDPDKGLTAAEVEESRRVNGENQFTREKPKSILRRIWEAMCEPMLIILLVALAITIAVQIVSRCKYGVFYNYEDPQFCFKTVAVSFLCVFYDHMVRCLRCHRCVL